MQKGLRDAPLFRRNGLCLAEINSSKHRRVPQVRGAFLGRFV